MFDAHKEAVAKSQVLWFKLEKALSLMTARQKKQFDDHFNQYGIVQLQAEAHNAVIADYTKLSDDTRKAMREDRKNDKLPDVSFRDLAQPKDEEPEIQEHNKEQPPDYLGISIECHIKKMLHEESKKDDNAKLNMALVPPEIKIGLARRFALGAKKYGVGNWYKGGGFDYSRIISAL